MPLIYLTYPANKVAHRKHLEKDGWNLEGDWVKYLSHSYGPIRFVTLWHQLHCGVWQDSCPLRKEFWAAFMIFFLLWTCRPAVIKCRQCSIQANHRQQPLFTTPRSFFFLIFFLNFSVARPQTDYGIQCDAKYPVQSRLARWGSWKPTGCRHRTVSERHCIILFSYKSSLFYTWLSNCSDLVNPLSLFCKRTFSLILPDRTGLRSNRLHRHIASSPPAPELLKHSVTAATVSESSCHRSLGANGRLLHTHAHTKRNFWKTILEKTKLSFDKLQY